MKLQKIPYTHAGIQLERINKDCLRLHQDEFCSKLTTYKIPDHRLKEPDSLCDKKEITIFRSLCCSALWACQTRLEELCAVTSLQVYLQTPKIEHIIAINCVIKRLRRPLKHGIFLWRLEPPLRIAGISDASAPNKQSNFATEGIIVCLAEDRISKIITDKDDFLIDEMVALLGGKMHILTGSSQKAKRISHSTSHAETLSSAKAIPLSQLIALRLCEPEVVTRRDFKMHRSRPMALLEVQESATVPLPVDSFIDCMDLWELAW